jgi:AcrR family transcriptional regulator
LSYKTPKDVQERKNANRQKLLNTAARIFSRRGYHATTVKDIVDEAGMSVGSFYFYFKNKEDILESLYDLIIPSILEMLDREVAEGSFGVVERICDVVTLTLKFFHEREDMAKVMLIEAIGVTPDFEQKNAEGFRCLSEAIERNLIEFKKDDRINVIDTKMTAMLILGEVHFAIINWLYGNTQPKLTDLAYPLATHQLRAMSVEFEEEAVKEYIETLLRV